MPASNNGLRVTETIEKVLGLRRQVCECGHNRDYHLTNGNMHCVFGVCDCRTYKHRSGE